MLELLGSSINGRNRHTVSRKTPTKNSLEECSLKILVYIVKMDIVESCEITATVAPSAG